MTELIGMGLHMAQPVCRLPKRNTLRKHYWRTYGTTLNGLQKFYHVDGKILWHTHGFNARPDSGRIPRSMP